MDKKALYNLSYGVFMLATRTGEVKNGCITNTCIQIANSPTRVVISLLNTDYTCDILKESGVFALSILDETCTFDTIKHFGFQSGRDVDKFADMELPEDVNEIPYLDKQACAVISCKVVSSENLESHTVFIAEVIDAKSLSEHAPLTYADYQSKVKPKPVVKPENSGESPSGDTAGNNIKAWRCKICGYVYEGKELPEDFTCPVCGHPAEDFEPIYEE